MLKKSLLIFIGALALSSALAQDKIEDIKKGGYTISSYSAYDTETSPMESYGYGYSPRTNVNSISDEQFKACLNGDAYGFFVELESYKTPLQRKFYEQDHTKEFNAYTDSLASLKEYYKSSYQVVTHEYYLSSAYDLKSKTFACSDVYTSCLVEGNEPNLVKLQNYTFRGIEGLMQVDSKIEITVEDERKALLVESKRSVSIMVIFNRFDVAGKVYKPRKVIYYLDGEIIQAFGSDPVINALLAKEEPVTDEDLDKEDESGGGTEVGGLDFPTNDGGHDGMMGEPDSGDDVYGGGNYGGGDDSHLAFSGLGNWERVGIPTVDMEMNCTLYLVFRIDRNGRIVSVAEDLSATSSCTYTPEKFDSIILDLKKNIQFRPHDTSVPPRPITTSKLMIHYKY